jgi:hypothetical protein
VRKGKQEKMVIVKGNTNKYLNTKLRLHPVLSLVDIFNIRAATEYLYLVGALDFSGKPLRSFKIIVFIF